MLRRFFPSSVFGFQGLPLAAFGLGTSRLACFGASVLSGCRVEGPRNFLLDRCDELPSFPCLASLCNETAHCVIPHLPSAALWLMIGSLTLVSQYHM